MGGDDEWKDYKTWDNETTWNTATTPHDIKTSKLEGSYKSPGSRSPWKKDENEFSAKYNEAYNDNQIQYKSEKNYLLKRFGYEFQSIFEGEKSIFRRN
ncbi:hypothetical protein H312_00326 [Anncaliia algerae PRA339]|uniref:Uncharacterized protein n=1 Tax=Anncaliia algerae PRA339 TaxID=1288291 RepID=A0A059F4T4_9MICR|nr:hypothetical protein H312_00326 [Anncaliia algerae PRA339]